MAVSARGGDGHAFRPERREAAASLEVHPRTDARAAALPINSAQTGMEPVEFQGEDSVQPAIDSDIGPAQRADARFPANSAILVLRREPLPGPERQATLAA